MSRLCGSRSGRQGGLRKVFGVTRKLTVSEELEMTQTLTELMDPVFDSLGINCTESTEESEEALKWPHW